MNVPKKLLLMRIFLVFVVVFVCYRVHQFHEPYALGQELANTQTTLFPRISLIMPIRKQVKYWIANVPLTPFNAPLIMTPYEGSFPNFLLYKPSKLSSVINQGDCGSCWAFAICFVLADRLALQSRGIFHDSLSTQQLLSCFKRTGCDGGSPEEASLWLAQTATLLATEQRYPYSQANGGWVSSACPKQLNGAKVGVQPNSVHSLVEFIPEENYDSNILAQNIQNMKAELLVGGPFYCAITVYDDLFTYTGSEVYTRQKGSSLVGGHAVEIIGYCDKGVDKRRGFESAYWICRSSWADNWPINTSTPGYFMVEMGRNMIGIESRCGFAHPELFTPHPLEPNNLPLTDFMYTRMEDYLSSK